MRAMMLVSRHRRFCIGKKGNRKRTGLGVHSRAELLGSVAEGFGWDSVI